MRKGVKKLDYMRHVPKHIRRLTLLGVGVLLIMVGAFVVMTYTKPVKNPAQLKAAADAVLQGNDTSKSSNMKTVKSDLGFKLDYDSDSLSAHAQTTDPKSTNNYVYGEDFEGEELSTTRSYSLVKLAVRTNSKNTIGEPELSVLTNIRKNHLKGLMALPENSGKTKEQAWVEHEIASQKKGDYLLVARSDEIINGITYTVLDFAYDSQKQYGLPASSVDRYYMTVQNDRAYSVNISNINTETRRQQVPKLEQVLSTISYPEPDASKFSFKGNASVQLAGASLPQTDNIKTPAGSIDDDTLYGIVAKNQPAVVRIGTSRCANVSVSFADGTSKSFGHLCAAGIGSGSFISSDGYIATNGHVTRLFVGDIMTGYLYNAKNNSSEVTKRITTILESLVKLGVISDSQKQAIEKAWKNQDPSVYSVLNSIGESFPLSSLHLENDVSTYAVQIGNEPMRIKDDLSGFTLTKTVISAKFVAANFYEDGPAGLNDAVLASGKSDVSILKVENGPYPVVSLGSIRGLGAGDKLVALGFPGFVDDGLQTSQQHTVPSATSGVVRSVTSDESVGGTGRMFIFSTVPIAQGNSGGPSFDKDGKVVGLNTYGKSECSNKKCFGDGIIRDIADLQKLAADNNVTISSESQVTEEWQKGLKAFQASDYGAAATAFDKERQLYPANYLAVQFGDIATENAPSLFRISQSDIPRTLLIYGIIITTWAILGCIIASIVHIVRGVKRSSSQEVPPVVAI